MAARARSLPQEYPTKAHTNVDIKYNGTAPGAFGPLEAALTGMGGVHPLVSGAFGEINVEFDDLLKNAAEVGALRYQGAMYVKTHEQARAALLWSLRRKTSASIFRANLDCLHNRMRHVQGDARGQRRRRDASRRRFFPGGDPSHASYRFREQHENYPGGYAGPW